MRVAFCFTSQVTQKRTCQLVDELRVVFWHERRPSLRKHVQNHHLAQGESYEHQRKGNGAVGVGVLDFGAFGEEELHDATKIAHLDFVGLLS